MTRILDPIPALLASATRQDLARQVAYLKDENRILRARLPERLVATSEEKRRLLKVVQKLGNQLKELMSFVTYQMFLRWIRERTTAANKRAPPLARKPGRPKTDNQIREIVLKLARENSWGYTRILGELRKLGVSRISRQTVKNIDKEHDLDPGPQRGKGTWDEFLKIHAATLWQCDFATKKMWTIRGFVDLYFLVFIHLGTRRCWISPSTVPDSAWSCQQARNFLMHAEDVQLPPKYVLRDNDAKYTAAFDEVFKSIDAEVVKNTPQSPNLRAHVERFIQTMQVECLDRFVVVSQNHLNLINREFQHWSNHERPHSARDFLSPGCESSSEPRDSIRLNDVVCETRLGGVLKSYSCRAA